VVHGTPSTRGLQDADLVEVTKGFFEINGMLGCDGAQAGMVYLPS
jgi:hypothetical protein